MSLAFLLVVTALDAGITAASPLLLRLIIDDAIVPRHVAVLVWLAAVTGALALVDAAALYAANWLSARVGQGMIYGLRTEVFDHVQRQPLAFFTRAQTGSLVSRLNTDVIGAQQAVTALLSQAVGGALTLLLVLGSVFYLSWPIGLLGLLMLPFFVLPGRVIGRRLQRLARESMQLDAELGSLMNERFNVAGAMLAKLYGRPSEESAYFARMAGRVRDIGVLVSAYSRLLFIVVTLVAALATALVYGVGGGFVIDGALQIGTLVALTTLLTRLYGPVNQMSSLQVNVMTALVSFDRVFEVLDLKPGVADRPDAVALPAPAAAGAPEIEFDRVSFRYPAAAEVSLASLQSMRLPAPETAANELTLRELSFHAPAGKLTALVGPSGAGKTTITHLVTRLYDPDAGAVRIGGHDIRELTLASLRDTIGVVPQDAHLFHDTIRANLAYARPGATQEEIVSACQAARIWNLISALPDGLDTVVGDRGYRLSGGEKQRLALARLLLKAPSVVVLDEATAHLDAESERAVQRALEAALSGRTSLVIAHRLSTIHEADQILVIDEGRVRERGTHDELLAAGGLYAELYRTQFARKAEVSERPVVVPEPADELLELSRAGRLVTEYPRVPQLLSGLSDSALLRAGRLLARLDPDEIQQRHPTVASVTVGITGHGTLAELGSALTVELARHGLLLRPVLGDFDSYVFDLGDPSSELRAAGADLMLCVLDPAVVFDEVPVPWTPADVERAAAAKLDLLERLTAQYTAAGQGTLVLNTMPLPRRYAGQLIDSRSRARLGAVWRAANARLLRLADEHPGVVVLDLDPVIADGVPVSDVRMSSYAKAHLTPELLAGYAREVGHLARQASGLAKKCLVLDLDNTLWGGVLGDDGIDGIEAGEGHRGEAFAAFQRVVKQLGAQGVLLAAVSKNDPELVRRALRDHPGMELREQDFVAVVANWRPKHDNLAALAGTLGLSTDSLVFVDDSDFERGLVRRELPGVTVIDVNDEPALHGEKLLRDGWFTIRELTAEDRARTTAYQAEAARQSFLDSFDSVEDYLRELDVSIAVSQAAETDVARLSQLTLRTNQFNLTTNRLQPEHVRELMADPEALVLAVRSGDRFGDNGLVGALFLRRSGDLLSIENFVLSCRVFSRGIERACLATVLSYARATKARAVSASYRPSKRNGAVADLYPRHGFVAVSRAEGEGLVLFDHDLTTEITPPGHVHLSVDPALGATGNIPV